MNRLGHLKFPLTLLVIPVVEFILLRIWLRDVLSLRIGYPGLTDYDFVPQVLVTCFLLGWIFFSKGGPALRFQRSQAFTHAGLLLWLVLYSILLAPAFSIPQPHKTLWYLLAASTFLSGFLIFLDLREISTRTWRSYFVLGVMAVASKPLLLLTLGSYWLTFTHLTGSILVRFGNFLQVPLQLEFGSQFSKILHPEHTLFIGKGCSGLDGMGLILFLVAIHMLSKSVLLTGSRALSLLLISSLAMGWMLVMNVLRIALFLVAALTYQRVWGTGGNFSFWIHVFSHNAVTWIVYGFGIFFFFSMLAGFESFCRKANILFRLRKPIATMPM